MQGERNAVKREHRVSTLDPWASRATRRSPVAAPLSVAMLDMMSQTLGFGASHHDEVSATKWRLDPNYKMSYVEETSDNLLFRRDKFNEFDAAIGPRLEHGQHEWTVHAPYSNSNNFIGVSVAFCDERTYPANTSAWAMYLHDATLCSGSASRAKKLRDRNGASKGNGLANPGWKSGLVPRGTKVRVLLDMEARTLSFAIGDADPQLAFTELPASVHPYLCSGAKEDNSVMVVSGLSA